MKVKTNLHFHSSDDLVDHISYSTKEGIDKAVSLGFGALAITCHQKHAWTEEYFEYAKSKGLLLISGIEIYIGETLEDSKRHVLILNGDIETEMIRTYTQLEQYKKKHPEIFIIAPHPYFYGNFSLDEHLEKYSHLFDAVEQSWFYSSWFNRNIKGMETADKLHLPFISTSDAHFFDFFDTNYCTVETENITPEGLFIAIRGMSFENTTSKRRFWRDMVARQGYFSLKEFFHRKYGKKLA